MRKIFILFLSMLLLGVVTPFGVKAWRYSEKVILVSKILGKDWNPYGNPPEYLGRYPYLPTAISFVSYVAKKHPTVEELTLHINKTEKEWLLRPNPERGGKVAKQILNVCERGRS